MGKFSRAYTPRARAARASTCVRCRYATLTRIWPSLAAAQHARCMHPGCHSNYASNFLVVRSVAKEERERRKRKRKRKKEKKKGREEGKKVARLYVCKRRGRSPWVCADDKVPCSTSSAERSRIYEHESVHARARMRLVGRCTSQNIVANVVRRTIVFQRR